MAVIVAPKQVTVQVPTLLPNNESIQSRSAYGRPLGRSEQAELLLIHREQQVPGCGEKAILPQKLCPSICHVLRTWDRLKGSTRSKMAVLSSG
jgi:hypothetical protein